MTPPYPLHLHPEVAEALHENRPVVALESTVIAHGLPYPQNITTALAMEEAIRANGATPATIAILGGTLTVGVDAETIERLGQSTNVRKCSRRDLPLVIGLRQDGATTVAGTMIIAHMAGIRLFATGGIGGVHRGHPFDVSADLIELGRTPVAVVCSGAKSILDLPLTLEVLETQGVPVIGYGTGSLPMFYVGDSDLPVDARVDTPEEAAAILAAAAAIGAQHGVLFTVPVPQDVGLARAESDAVTAQAVIEADAAGISGKALTPFLLRRIADLSDARSLAANHALLLNNARVAAQIAVALADGAV